MTEQSFDAVVLDVGLPDVDGFDLCRQIRSRSAVPIVFLTARGEEIDRIVGLEIGADDYISKPFSPRELTARLRAIFRRINREVAPVPEKPDAVGFAVDEDRRRIGYRGTWLDLTPSEYRLLLALVRRPGRVFSREELMGLAWDDPGASLDRTVDAHIKAIRAKIRDAFPDADPIETRRGFGYALRSEP
jgi:two-component system catabolic regulation response regulator CreB